MIFESNIILFSLLAALATILGGILPLLTKKADSRLFAALAAGILISTAFLEIIPEGLSLGNTAFGIAMGFVLMYLLEHALMIHSSAEHGCKIHRIGMVGICGITFHSLIDGIAIAGGFLVSPVLGIVITVSVIAHEFPEGLATSSLLLASKYSKKATVIGFVIVALATPIAAIVTMSYSQFITSYVLGLALTFSAGTFIYIGATDLLPYVHTQRRKKFMLAFLAGFLAIVLLSVYLG
ncbi:MAG: ZIP family metal transporter [Candidatus Aenigmatarchaeota archaeon]